MQYNKHTTLNFVRAKIYSHDITADNHTTLPKKHKTHEREVMRVTVCQRPCSFHRRQHQGVAG